MAGLRGGIPAAMGRVASPLQRLPPPLWSPILGMLGSLSGGRELPSRRLCFLSDGRCMLQSIPFWDPCPSLVHTISPVLHPSNARMLC